MYKRLYETEGKKIIIIGNSAVPFGVRSDLLEEEIPGYKVINFGLYGAIGTKAMLDLSKDSIQAEDIVIVMPELNEQALSLYFSAEEFWRAADCNYSLLKRAASENIGALVGNYSKYVAEKFRYIRNNTKPNVSGVYAQSSFMNENGEEVGYITFDRPYNIMTGGYDANNLLKFDTEMFAGDFVNYINEYNDFYISKGASMYFGFAPINRLGLLTEEGIEDFYNFLFNALNSEILGDPNESILDYEWFYDSNFHLNSAGAYVYTRTLCEQIKAQLGISTPTKIEVPDKPEIPITDIINGDNADEEYFIYEKSNNGVIIIGLSDKGKDRTSLQIPYTYEGEPVIAFAKEVFAGNTTISEIKLSDNIRILYDNSFYGCRNLTKLIITIKIPGKVGVGAALLNGAAQCKIYVPQDAYDLYVTHYNWGAYRNVIVSY